ncbi:hypothetical protein [Lacunimicrobium album]
MNEQPDSTSRLTIAGCWLISLVSLTLLSVRLFDTPVLMSANDRSRWCTVWSVVEKGTFTIDEIRAKPGWDTIDKVYHEGHYYSSKPPFLALLTIPVYWVLKQTLGLNLLADPQLTGHIVLFLINLIPLAFGYWVWALMLKRLGLKDVPLLLMQTVFCFGTLILPYATTLNNHLPGALSLLFSLYFFLRTQPGQSNLIDLAWCGFWAGMTFAFELPAASYVVLLGLLLLKDDFKKTLMAYAPAGLIVVAAFLVSNAMVTGSIKPFYSYYGTEKYLHEVAGIPSYWADPKGVDKAPDSFAVYFLHCTIGHHGIFSLTPFWLLLFPAFVSMRRWTQTRQHQVALMAIMISLVVFGFYMTKTEHYNFGGVTVALRWMVWLIPLWLVTIASWMTHLPFKQTKMIVCLVLLVPSIISAWTPWIGPWRHPWLFQVMDKARLIDQYRDDVKPFAKPLKTWFTTLPKNDQQLPYWAVYRSVDTQGHLMTMRLEVTSVKEGTIELTRTIDGQQPLSFTLSLNAFENGDAISKQLITNPSPEALEFVRGFVAKETEDLAYRPGFDRYLKLPFQNDYLRCQRSAVNTRLKLPESGIWVGSNCDLWLNETVPFGTAQFATTLTDFSTGETMSRRLWTMLDHSGLHQSDLKSER